MGEVWQARHRLLRRDAAVKLVIPDLLARTGSQARRHIRERFELEAQAIASLRSPHTVALYDFGVSEEGVAVLRDGTAPRHGCGDSGQSIWRAAARPA